ncbi:MAG: LysM peptidoglycan-binding domain-containing protein [Bacillota bacterium]|nr:LysM peptidoglycan-binding domain-containing protein [Bacillota bacterium]
MLKRFKTLIAVAALSGTVSANVHAADITIKKGDTLWDISKIHNVSVDNIKNLNHLPTNLIHPGERLTVLPEKHYTVKSGDTLWNIAQDNKISVESIIYWNKLISDQPYPGLNLVLFEKENTTPVEKPVEQDKKTAAKTSVIKKVTALKPVPAVKRTSQPVKPTVMAAKTVEHITSNVKTISVKATAYTANCPGCSGKTKLGIDLKANPNAKVISVDPSVIPLGSKVYVEGYGYATAADTGGAIKGKRIDVFIPSEAEAVNFGAKQLTVKIIN